MNLLDFIFRLGVVFAIYGFLWGIIEVGIYILSRGRNRTITEIYLIKAVKYFFLADVTLLFCLKGSQLGMVELDRVILAGIILLTYFIGKLQKSQNRYMFTRFAAAGLPQAQPKFNMKAESIIIALSLVVFAVLWNYPQYAFNPISNWFHESIINIEDTPVFGFIFKVIGFFFLLSLIFKMISAFTFILNGGKVSTPNQPDNNDQNSNDFDDYEEIK